IEDVRLDHGHSATMPPSARPRVLSSIGWRSNLAGAGSAVPFLSSSGHQDMAEHDLLSIAFPTLDEAQIARLSTCTAAVPRSFRDGQTLFAVGERNTKFFVVNSGEVAIIDASGDEPKQVVVHRKGQFTGEVSHLSGGPAVVSAIARGPCEVIEMS